MDNVKLFSKNEKELKTQIQSKRIYSQDIRMEFDILIMKSRKRQIMEGIELPNQEKNQSAKRKRNLQVLGNTIKQVEMKEKFLKSLSDERENF